MAIIKRPLNTNIFFGVEGVAADFRDENNTILAGKDGIHQFANSKIYKDGLAFYRNFSNNGAVLQTMNSQHYIDSYRTAYLYQSGIPAFDNTQDYRAGSVFMVGTIPHIVIPEDNSYTNVVNFKAAPINTPDFSSTDPYSETLLLNTFEGFRRNAVPLTLYLEGITKPVESGLNLMGKYPAFFYNCNGAIINHSYNQARREFIDNALPFLKSGTDYKAFNVPQGFGLVNNANGMGTTTGGGDGAGISAVDNHLINQITTFQLGQNYIYPATTDTPPTGTICFQSQVTIGNPHCVNKPADYTVTENGANFNGVALQSSTTGTDHVVYLWGDNPTAGDRAIFEAINNHVIYGRKMEKLAGGDIDEAYFNQHPNTGAGLQLGFYTLLKQL